MTLKITTIKISMQCPRRMHDQQKDLTNRTEPVAVPLGLPKIPHRVTWNGMGPPRERQLMTSSKTRIFVWHRIQVTSGTHTIPLVRNVPRTVKWSLRSAATYIFCSGLQSAYLRRYFLYTFTAWCQAQNNIYIQNYTPYVYIYIKTTLRDSVRSYKIKANLV